MKEKAMKIINKILTRFFFIFLIAVIFVFDSCSDGLLNSGGSEKNLEGSPIRICLGLKGVAENDVAFGANARTVMANENDNRNLSNLSEIKLYAKSSTNYGTLGTDGTLLVTWKTYSEMCSSPYSKTIASGEYDFMLTAKNYGATVTQSISGINISAGATTTLEFTRLSVSPNGLQTGGIEVELDYNSSYGNLNPDFKKYVSASSVISISLDSNLIVTKNSSEYSISRTTYSVGNTYEINAYGNTTRFISSPISAGFHVVQFTFTADDGSVIVYPVPVYVEAGYLSRETLTPFWGIENVTKNPDAGSFTITYNSNSATPSTVSQTFYEGSSLADAEALGFSSGGTKRFRLWNTKSDGTGTSYAAGDTPNITGDITLYAQWGDFKKVTYIINLDNVNCTYIQRYESASSLIAPENAFPNFDSAGYVFCGWDTKSDGSGMRYDKNEKPYITRDTVLYAQWCGKSSATSLYEYTVRNANEWNAVMGAPFSNTVDGEISVKVGIQGDFANPNLSLTKGKTFKGKLTTSGLMNYTISGLSDSLFDKIGDGAEVDHLVINASLCRENYGTIKNVMVSGIVLTGNSTDDSIGAICNRNYGTIENCSVTSCTVDGKTKNKKYTGGICGYNGGKILGSGTVSLVSLSGNEYCGYVAGYNKTNAVNENSSENPISSKITVKNVEGVIVLNKSNETLSSGSSRKYEPFSLNRCAKVYFSLKDSSGGSKTNKETLVLLDESGAIVKKFITSGTPNVDTYLYLNKGTYRLMRTNLNSMYTSYMNLKIVTY